MVSIYHLLHTSHDHTLMKLAVEAIETSEQMLFLASVQQVHGLESRHYCLQPFH